MNNWIYGCDVCQEVCPFNRFAQSPNPAMSPSPISQSLNIIAPPLLELLSLTEDYFNHRFAHSPIKRIKRPRFLRNVCVAVGNWRSETAVSPLIILLHDHEPIIRGHAAWALRQIGTAEAQTALTSALLTEMDERVRLEINGQSL
jgi:epoxyqueuosine reductase